MAGMELPKHFIEQPVNLLTAKTVDAFDDIADPGFPAGIEEAGNDAANIVGEGDRQTPHLQIGTSAFTVY